MTASEKITELLKYLNINAKSFADRLGYERPQIIYDIQKGKTKRISPDLADKITSVFTQINRSWLLADEGEMLKQGSSNVRPLGLAYAAYEGDEGVAMVDYVPATATASFIEYVGVGNPELDKIAVMKQPGEILDDSYKVFEVIGESMSPAIPNRAKILTRNIVQSKWEQAEGVVVVVFGDEVVVKRIINNDIAINNSLVLSSDNPKYGERRIALADIRAIYKAIRIVSADIL